MANIFDDEMPIHFECLNCGYEGTDDELIDDGEDLCCPMCDSLEII